MLGGSGGAYYSAELVAGAIGSLAGRFTYNKDDEDAQAAALGLGRLNDLKEKLEQSEREFYKALGLTGPGNLNEQLQKIVDYINNLLDNPVIKFCISGTDSQFLRYFRINHGIDDERLTPDEILEIFDLQGFVEEYAADHVDEFAQDGANLVAAMIQSSQGLMLRKSANAVRLSQETLPTKSRGKAKIISPKATGYQNKTLAAVITVTTNPLKVRIDSDKVSYRTFRKLTTDLFIYFANRIENPAYKDDPYVTRARQVLNKRADRYPTQDFRDILSTTFYDYASHLDPTMAKRISNRLKDHRIAITNNNLTIAGALGEAAAIVVMEELQKKYPKISHILPIGTIRNDKGQEISVDMLLKIAGEEFNFQVKNYKLQGEKGSYTFDRDYTVVGMATAMQVPFLDAVIELFGMYQFNQYREGNGVYDFSATRAQIEGTVERSKDYLRSYVDRLLGIDKTFQAHTRGELGKVGLHFNTFFMVSGKIIPSSVMVGALAQSVTAEGGGTEAGIENIDITYGGPIAGSELSYPVVRPKERHYDHGHEDGTVQAYTAAEQIRAKVRFVVNYNTLFATALNSIKG